MLSFTIFWTFGNTSFYVEATQFNPCKYFESHQVSKWQEKCCFYFKIPLIFEVLGEETHHCIFVANHVEKGGEKEKNIIVVKMTRWLFLDFWRLDWQNEFCKIRWRENCKFGSHLGNGRITAIHLSQKEVFKRYWDRLLCNNYNPMFYITSLQFNTTMLHIHSKL